MALRLFSVSRLHLSPWLAAMCALILEYLSGITLLHRMWIHCERRRVIDSFDLHLQQPRLMDMCIGIRRLSRSNRCGLGRMTVYGTCRESCMVPKLGSNLLKLMPQRCLRFKSTMATELLNVLGVKLYAAVGLLSELGRGWMPSSRFILELPRIVISHIVFLWIDCYGSALLYIRRMISLPKNRRTSILSEYVKLVFMTSKTA